MKVSINSIFLEGPYGGGVQFAKGIKKFLEAKGVSVINHLRDSDIDIILHVNPFPFLTGTVSAYSFLDAYAYKLKYPQAIIVQRINECDERKGTNFMNKLLVESCAYADFVVVIGSWLRPLLLQSGLSAEKPMRTILSGADNEIFNMRGKQWWRGQGKLKIVTHHWSPGYRKGHDMYQMLDMLLDDKAMSELFEFTYIGSRPKNVVYKNTRFIDPIFGKALGDELRTHDGYITASQNDPGPMHSLEAMASGLPILYINSGALPEQCNGFGIEYTKDTLKEKLLELRAQYDAWSKKIQTYSRTSEVMGGEYLDLFTQLLNQRKESPRASLGKRVWFWLFSKAYTLKWAVKRRLIKH